MKVLCPHCQTIQSVPDEYAGKRGKCVSCHQVIEICANVKMLPQVAPAPQTMKLLKLHIACLWLVVGTLLLLTAYHVTSRPRVGEGIKAGKLTLRRLAIANEDGEERIVLRTFGKDTAYLELCDGSDNGNWRLQLYTLGPTLNAGMEIKQGERENGCNEAGIVLDTSWVNNPKLRMINDYGGGVLVETDRVKYYDEGTFKLYWGASSK